MTSTQNISSGEIGYYTFNCVSNSSSLEHAFSRLKLIVDCSNPGQQFKNNFSVDLPSVLPYSIVRISSEYDVYDQGDNIKLYFNINSSINATIGLNIQACIYEEVVCSLNANNLTLAAQTANYFEFVLDLPNNCPNGQYYIKADFTNLNNGDLNYEATRLFWVQPSNILGDISNFDFSNSSIIAHQNDFEIAERISEALPGSQILYTEGLTAGDLLQAMKNDNLILVGGYEVNELVDYLTSNGTIDPNIWQNPGDAHVIILDDPFIGIAPAGNKAIVVAGYYLEDTFVAGLKLLGELDNPSEIVSTPYFDPPAPHAFYSPTSISLSCETQDATIHYTTDGSEPDESSPSGTSVNISTTTTLKAKAFKSGWESSLVKTGLYTFNTITYSISGTITDNSSNGIEDVEVNVYGDANQTTFTNSNGQYSFGTLVASGDYNIFPISNDHIFIPEYQAFSDLSGNETANFSTTHAPVLSWTGDIGFEADGLDPETGNPITTFIFKVTYSDPDNDAPKFGYPVLHIYIDGNEIQQSPFTLNEDNSNPYTSGRNYIVEVTGLEAGNQYAYKFEAFDSNDIFASGEGAQVMQGPEVITIPDQISLNLNVFLEGPFNGSGMIAYPNSNYIPTEQPYFITPWYYLGDESYSVFPNENIVDWILVELRDAVDANAATNVATITKRACFVLNDGTIIGIDGLVDLTFNTTVANNLFVVIWHRNHLGIMSSSPLSESDGIYSYTFSSGVDQAYGGALAQTNLGNDKYGMIGGDGNSDGFVDIVDKSTVWTPSTGEKGYHPADFNLDNQINNKDKNDVLSSSIGYRSHLPEFGFSCGSHLIDIRNGKNYSTILIGTQCWMAENINIGTRIDGAGNQQDNATIEKYCYNNEEDSCDIYGGLFQWNEMMQYTTQAGTQGICPDDWHIPTDAEWTELTDFLGGESVAGGKLKETGLSHWHSPNTGASNESGFAGLPGGYKNTSGGFQGRSYTGFYWSSLQTGDRAWARYLHYNNTEVSRDNSSKINGFSVRCLKDEELPTWSCGDALIDTRDTQSYETVQIGIQCWMAENLNIGDRLDGTVPSSQNGIIEKYCFNNEEDSCDVYGGLFQWNEVMQYTTQAGTQGICPDDWHIPTDAEWTELTDFLGGESVAGGKLKETGLAHWHSPNTGASNESGFAGLPGGYKNTSGGFQGRSYTGFYWSSLQTGDRAWARYLHYNNTEASRDNSSKINGFSVRCVKD